MSEHQAVKIEPVVKQIKVGLNQEAAFRLFTEGQQMVASRNPFCWGGTG